MKRAFVQRVSNQPLYWISRATGSFMRVIKNMFFGVNNRIAFIVASKNEASASMLFGLPLLIFAALPHRSRALPFIKTALM
jgi:hypothetical protein